MLFSPDFIPPSDLPQLQNKALLIVDLQNDFVTPEGKLPVDNIPSFIKKVTELTAKFRSQGRILWVRTESLQPQPTISEELGSYRIVLKEFLQTGDDVESPLQTLTPDANLNTATIAVPPDQEAFLADWTRRENQCCMPNTPGCQYPTIIQDAIDVKSDLDLIKSDYSAFANPSLLLHLRQGMITNLYICGALSNISVYATVLDAVRHGLMVTIIEDCVGYRDEDCHLEAMRQMADAMGAEGIDYQELMDDLSGLLGDVIREEDFSQRFELSVSNSMPPSRSVSEAPHPPPAPAMSDRSPLASDPTLRVDGDAKDQTLKALQRENMDLVPTLESSSKKSDSHRSSASSEPRKRSVSDVDESTGTKHMRSNSLTKTTRRASDEAPRHRVSHNAKTRVRRSRPANEGGTFSPLSPGCLSVSKSEGDLPGDADTESPPTFTAIAGLDSTLANGDTASKKMMKTKTAKEYLEPGDRIGEDDCRVVLNFIPFDEATRAFEDLKQTVKWQQMLHRSGQVPRLVAVQGATKNSGNIVPIYRHPADEAPELLPFTDTVQLLRKVAEEVVGHPLNHVLIQHYRSGEDNISEHSDKTLDIVHGSSVVNVSLGATRTMTLRTKKSVDPDSEIRKTQHIRLPHASLFVLGQKTNQYWLHSIRPDKRLPTEKTAEELEFGQERISLTFRHIGTFINTVEGTIWGQGATRKDEEHAKRILSGPEAKEVGENMINAFGAENHLSSTFSWEKIYGNGFDVVNFEVRKG